MALKLYSFWRSIATYRVRIALNLKGIVPDEVIDVDLLQGKQRDDAFRAVNPQMVIPALVDGDGPALFQSMAILEYIEETHSEPPLLPRDPRGRARVRGLCQVAIADAHPMSVPRVRNYLARELKLDPAQVTAWAKHWQSEALAVFEAHLSRESETGRYCHGDAITLADICLAGQAAGSQFFGIDIAAYPTCARIVELCMQNEAFAKAHPLKQPGAPASISH